MPCDDCSRAEGCPPCVNEPECWCGHPEERHTTSLPEEGREDYCTECDGENDKHSFSVAREPKGSDGSSTERNQTLDDLCYCGHPWRRHLEPPGAQCTACPGDSERSWRHEFVAAEADEPPLAPEEERGASCTCADAGDCFAPAGHYADCPAKEALEDERRAICGNCYTDHAQGFCEPTEAPPQPLRRPPYAVAYSVAGHLYEIALPGDATVHATDGGLIITHTLGPVAGVVRVHPIEGERSA